MGDILNFEQISNSQQRFLGSEEILTTEQLAKLIHKSPSSVRSDASRNPTSLPPICRLPGNKRLLWRLVDVQTWIANHVEQSSRQLHGQLVIQPIEVKKRGRPRKTLLLAEAIS